MRTLTSVLTIAVALVGLASPAAADDDEGEIELLTRETAAVTAGDTAWVALNWTADEGAVDDVALTLRDAPRDGVVVSYPENTGTYTGLMNGPRLDEGEIDFTAVRVHVPATFTRKRVRLTFDLSYVTDGERETERVQVRVPVVRYDDGEHLVQHESHATVAAGSSAWVDVDFTGLAPVVGDLRLTAAGDLALVYPAHGRATSLHHDLQLDDGETDTARVRVDAGDASPGEYVLTTEVTYTFAGRTHARPGEIVVTITG